MKKTYIQPAIKAKDLNSVNILAASASEITGTTGTGGVDMGYGGKDTGTHEVDSKGNTNLWSEDEDE